MSDGRRNTAEDFFSRVTIDQKTGCHLWTGPRDGCGYGLLGFERPGKQRAHRVAWRLHYGVWPDKQVLHRCDAPACVNPDHLFAGDHHDNMADKSRKGRTGLAKLSDDDVRTIRGARANGSSLAELGARFGVSKPHIWKLCALEKRRHV